ncbi:MAG: hypothetical protein ACREBU_20550 [Nitrososphaera sp.]
MNWQVFYQFLTSIEIIPFLVSLFLILLFPLFSKFVEDEVVKRHLPKTLKSLEKDIIDFSVDAARKVGFISALFIAAVNSLLLIAKGGRAWIYPAVISLALILVTFLVLPRISPYDFHKIFLRIRWFRWLWTISMLINMVLIYLAFDAFVTRLTPMPPLTPSPSPVP